MREDLLSIVVPAHNEEENIRPLYERLCQCTEGLVGGVEILFVDDGSTDATADVVAALHSSDPRVGMLQLSRNFGHQVALMAGLDNARGDAVVCMDADLQHPPELLPSLIKRWRGGALVVQTVRRDDRKTGVFKVATSRLFYVVMQRLTELPIVAGAADFFLLDRRVVDAMNLCREENRFTRGLIPWLGFRRELIEYQPGSRLSGKTKYTLRQMVRFALDGLFAFTVKPLRLAGCMGLLATLLGLLYLSYVGFVVFLNIEGIARGWASTVGLIALMGGVQLVTLWLLGEYVARIAGQTRNRPPYLVAKSLRSDPRPE